MTQLILHSDIIVPENRQREEFKESKLKDLADSIFEHGLLHPIILRDDGKTLVAGERRYRALEILFGRGKAYKHNGDWIKDKSVPYTRVGELSEHELAAVEYAENALRLDLTWQEKAKACKQLHDLRISEHGEYNRSTGEGQTVKKTATEILGIEATGLRAQQVSDSIQLAEYLDDPIVSSAPDLKTAKRALRTLAEHKKRDAAVDKFQRQFSPHTLILGDCFKQTLPAAEYDVIITDPPYGINADTSGTFDMDKHEYDDSEKHFKKLMEILPGYTYKLAKQQAHMFLFCDIRQWTYLRDVFTNTATWWVWPKPLIWYKGNIGSFPHPDHGPRFTYEAILYCIKGKRKQNTLRPDVIHVNQKTQTEHPASKPVELFTELLNRVARPDDKVLDLFAGSGPIFPAADATHCTATGIELNPKYHAMAQRRLDALAVPNAPIPFDEDLEN